MSDKTIQRLREWLPLIVLLASLVAGWVRLEVAIGEHAKQLEELRERISRSCDFGPDGFSDPTAHSAHDLHIRHWLETTFGRRGLRKLQNDYSVNGNSR